VNGGVRTSAHWLLAGADASQLRFGLLHQPADSGAALRGLVLHLPPFAEELNKSRRMTSATARELAAAGFVVLQPDLHGCGDSPEALREARWSGWIEDVVASAAWLRARHGAHRPLWLWGLRAGALLASAAAKRLPGPLHMLFWQPSPQGKAVVQQFLRLKTLGDMATSRQSGAELRAQLASGNVLDIAGYLVTAGLLDGLEASTLAAGATAPGGPGHLVWLECSAQPQAELAPAATLGLQPWQAAGWQVQQQLVQGQAFWQTTEITHAPALVQATVAALCMASPAEARGESGVVGPSSADTQGATRALSFDLAGDTLWGMLHAPPDKAPVGSLGVVVVVGGPQTRLGSHRQFVHLAQTLAAAGHATLRFDVRGMGDSTGEPRSFEALDADIDAAVSALLQARPDLRGVVLWGLCDGASAACLYLAQRADARVRGLCLANPWVRSAQSLAQTQVRHYYLRRVLSRDFWAKLLRGGVGATALRSLLRNLRLASGKGSGSRCDVGESAAGPFQDRMLQGLHRLQGPALVLLSEHDYTAQEFVAYTQARPGWRAVLQQATVTQAPLPGADHTFSNPGGKDAVAAATLQWLRRLST
jgi:exosortase A-associated hydrolase 1/exosortase A-associated hydrolase 2